MSFWDSLQRFLNAPIGGAPKTPPPAPRVSRTSRAGDLPEIRHLGAPDQPPMPVVRYQKERFGPKIRGLALPVASVRKRVLVALAGVSVLAMIGFGLAQLVAERRLPSAVTGLWRAESAAYAGRVIELRSRYLAFLVDTSGHVVTYRIARVRQSEDADGILYRVQFDTDSGGHSEFSFVYNQGPPEQLRFAHQRQLLWRKDRSDRTLIIR